MPSLFIIRGANGAGKTTAALQLSPNFLEIFEYVNADEIAKDLSPFNPESVAIKAGLLRLQRLERLSNAGTDFDFKSTFLARNYTCFLRAFKAKNYVINLIYFWLQSPELAMERVRRRVESGGHNIPEETIRRRYERGHINLIELYLPLCDKWIIYDNSTSVPELVAECPLNSNPIVYQSSTWNKINLK